MLRLSKNLESYCESFENAIHHYDGEKYSDSFIEWYRDTYLFSAEIIYYHNAMEFLSENDPSLRDSTAKAADCGYSCEDINSELLASLLLQDILENELQESYDDINEYFENLKG